MVKSNGNIRLLNKHKKAFDKMDLTSLINISVSFTIMSLERTRDVQCIYLRGVHDQVNVDDEVRPRIIELKSLAKTLETFAQEISTIPENLLKYHPSALREWEYINQISLHDIPEEEITIDWGYYQQLIQTLA